MSIRKKEFNFFSSFTQNQLIFKSILFLSFIYYFRNNLTGKFQLIYHFIHEPHSYLL
jgi:hypothetical protein